METNGNQRKRGGRTAKNTNEKSLQSQNIEVMDVSAVAISPTLEESETVTNAPAAECRRSSRKKIIKFDVRDLLNKNRKTHKIQIEARIDSNAPTISKAATAGCNETDNSKSSSSTREDLLSKQKTFLEKSAIFRRYSTSQEHKPPPLPLPLPPLLGKTNDNKDVGLTCSSNSRRLSRTQEFFSNVMIKPKQTTSLIVAQIESNAPCSVTMAKRKTFYKSSENKVVTRPETEYSSVIQQKKRGRPAKVKIQSGVETTIQEDSAKKKMSPEKAKNWKEYKACLAQQVSSSKDGKDSLKVNDQTIILSKMQQEVKNFDDTLQSDISRSDDDGNFSGFQSCDSPILAKVNLVDEKSSDNLDTNNTVNNEAKTFEKKTTNDVEAKSTIESNEKNMNIKPKLMKTDEILNSIMVPVVESKQYEKQKICLSKVIGIASEETLEFKLTSLKSDKIDTKDCATVESEVTQTIKPSTSAVKQTVSNSGTSTEKVSDISQNKEFKYKTDDNTILNKLNIEEKTVQYKSTEEQIKSKDSPKNVYPTDREENDTTVCSTFNQSTRNKNEEFTRPPRGLKETTFEPKIQLEELKQGQRSVNSQNIYIVPENQTKTKTGDILPKTTQIEEKCSPQNRLTLSNVSLLASQMPQIAPEPSTSSKEQKSSFSRTSSSSESENASEHSSYTSESFSTTSSSSQRSYKSGDKLRVSIKRISLPKSPSTSSQTSTSEELNNSNVIKRKPPMVKRSKRLQKRFEEIIENKNVTENIDESLHDNEVGLKFEEEISSENIILSVQENKTEIYDASSKVSVIGDKSTELVKYVVAEPITQELMHVSNENITYEISDSQSNDSSNELVKNVVAETITHKLMHVSTENVTYEITDSQSNDSSNVEYLSAKEQLFKRKSLRNRKEHNSYGKDIVKPNSKLKQKHPEKEIDVKHTNEVGENISIKGVQILENITKIPTAVEKSLEFDKVSGKDQSDESVDDEQRKKSKSTQSSKQQIKKQITKQSLSLFAKEQSVLEEGKVEILMATEEKIIPDKVVQSTNIESENDAVGKFSNEEINLRESENDHAECEKLTGCKIISKKQEISKVVAEILADFGVQETSIENLSEQSIPQHKIGQKTGTVSKETKVETNDNIRDKTKSPSRKPTKADKQTVDSITTAKTKTNKEVQDERQTSENQIGQSNELMQLETSETTPDKKNAKIETTKNEINKEDINTKDIQFQDKKLVDNEAEETVLRKQATQSLKTQSIQEEKSITQVAKGKEAIFMSIEDKPETSAAADHEASADNTEKDCKNILPREEIINYKIFTTNDTNVQEANQDKETNFTELSTTSEREILNPKIMQDKTLDSAESKTKTSAKKMGTIDELTRAKKIEKVIKSISGKSKEEEMPAKELINKVEYPIHSSTQDEFSPMNELMKLESSLTTTDKYNKEESYTAVDELKVSKIDTIKSHTDEEIISTVADTNSAECKKAENISKKETEINITAQYDKSIMETEEDLAVNNKDFTKLTTSTTEKECSLGALQKSEEANEKHSDLKSNVCSSENSEKFSLELSSSSFPTEINSKTIVVSMQSHPDTILSNYQPPDTKPHSLVQNPPEISLPSSLIYTLPIKHTECSEPSLETNLANESQIIDQSPNSTTNLTEISTSYTQQENILQKNKKPILVTKGAVAKRRGRKPRFKNLDQSEFDSETDSSNGKNTPVNEITDQNRETETKMTREKPIENKKTPSPQTILEKKTTASEIVEKPEVVNTTEEHADRQESSQANLLSSQIKNVSIETNTLLDILRTVQSNTEAALKANKSPTNIDIADSENAVESTALKQFEESQDVLKIQQESQTIETQSPSSCTKKLNLSPERSDTASPLTLKKLTSSPTRSNSSSPLTLKKLTRRYERRSRRGEESAHKTLEETFAEIAAQSSKAVLAAKEYDINEQEQVTENQSQENLNELTPAINSEKDKIKEYFADVEQTPVDADKQTNETLLIDSQDVEKPPTVYKENENNLTENVTEMEMTKVIPAKRGRKPKNRPLEVPITTSKETLEVKNSPKTKKTPEVEKEIASEKESVENVDEEIKNETDKLKKVTDSSTAATQDDLQVVQTESANLSEIRTELNLKPLENLNDSKSSKKSSKKRDTKSLIEEDALSTTNVADEALTPTQPATKKQSKSETKSMGKKVPKKSKNEDQDDDSLNLQQKDEMLVKAVATTPPPSKRGRKPKNQQPETPHSTTSSKKKNKKDICSKNDDEYSNVEKEPSLESETESLNASFDKSLDEKLAKKKRQKKLKEAFEAALADDMEKNKMVLQTEASNPINNSNSFGLTLFNNSPSPPPPPPPPVSRQSMCIEEVDEEAAKLTCITPVEPEEEDPDPLKDIEKFIADGVNLLKKDYKLNEDSVDDVIQTTPPSKATQILKVEEPANISSEEIKTIFNTFETPTDTPINTPSATPPPKSPTSIESTTPDENSGVRRSHRIKLITKTPKALVGRGLVRDKERFSIKDDVETKSHYTLDDHLTDLAEVEAKNAKFLKEMEERLSNFQVIKENDYMCERVISREARKMICDCFLTHEEEGRGELGCGEDCLNRLLMIECGPECNVKERCTNKRFQKWLCSPCRVFRTEKKGFGIMADIEILPGEFIMEYVGEVIDTEEFENRRIMYSQEKNRHYYFMALRSDAIIDATIKGNISRFINHSCDPNAETQKWTVNGELRIGFFSRKSIMPGEEITFNYQYQRYGREAQRCYCESANCRGWIGQEPTSDEGEQMDDEDDESEDEEGEEADTSNLLVHDDDEDSDTSVADPEEVQKQLEMAAAQAEVELAPLQLLEEKGKHGEITADECKSIQGLNKSDNEEDSKSKFKKLLSKMAEKVAAKQKQNKREQKMQRKKKSKKSTSELTNKLRFLEDPDIEDEVEFLKECGLKNQSDTLRLSRLMVRAKLVQTRLNLLEILRKGDLPCRRLFLDYHGLRLLHGWMSEDGGNMQIRLSLLQTLETLPIANKTVLTDSKVMQAVRNWCGNNTNLSPNDDSSSSNSNSQEVLVPGSATFDESSEMAELQKLALKLITTWEGLPEIFRIPKKERIEQMKEHEREADRQYAASAETQENTTATDRYRRDRFGRGLNTSNNASGTSNRFVKPNRNANAATENIKNLSKAQRREMFAAKVARDEAEKRLAEERREFETKCRFFGLDPKKTRTHDIPFCVNPATGQWFSVERKPINTPPSYAHVQVPLKPKSTDPNDYQLPSVCSTLPPQWKYAITTQGKIYYYHIKHRNPQWEPPSNAQLQQCELESREEDSESELTTTAGEDSSDDDDDILIGMDAAQLKAYIDKKVETRRQKRYQRLVDQRSISPRREEDRIYNQLEVRKYKENKEKIRKRKEDIRRKRAEALRQTSLNMCTLGSITDTNLNVNVNTNKLNTESDEELGTLPIQDYLLSSDEEVDIKAEVNSPLIDKIVEGDKIVDELDALTTKRQLKRPLPPHRDLNSEPSTSSASASTLVSNAIVAKTEYKKRKLEKKEKRKPKEQDAKYRKNKEKFRCDIAGIIVHHLKPYLKETCTVGRIQSNEDFNHLARKLTHFVMIKELKYCESVGQTLVVTESVKSKSREFIKKYMAKYGDVYVKPTNDPDFKDIPFTL